MTPRANVPKAVVDLTATPTVKTTPKLCLDVICVSHLNRGVRGGGFSYSVNGGRHAAAVKEHGWSITNTHLPDLAYRLTKSTKYFEERSRRIRGIFFKSRNSDFKPRPRLVRWMDGRKGKLARERNGAIWREGSGADRFGRRSEIEI